MRQLLPVSWRGVYVTGLRDCHAAFPAAVASPHLFRWRTDFQRSPIYGILGSVEIKPPFPEAWFGVLSRSARDGLCGVVNLFDLAWGQVVDRLVGSLVVELMRVTSSIPGAMRLRDITGNVPEQRTLRPLDDQWLAWVDL
jgi:hypothetical protein